MGIFTKKATDKKPLSDRLSLAWYSAWAFLPWLASKAVKGIVDGWKAGKL